MPRPSPADFAKARIQNGFIVKDKQTAALATATQAAQAGTRHYVLQVDASYSTSSTSGLLQLKSGAALIAEKYIHGSGAFDFASEGLDAENVNEAVSAELASGGVGIIGTVTLMGFSVSEGS